MIVLLNASANPLVAGL